MHDRTRILSTTALTAGLALAMTASLGCGDSTGEPADGSTSSGDTTAGPTTSPTVTNTQTSLPDTTTEATSLDSTTSEPTTAGGPAEIEVSIDTLPVESGGSYDLVGSVDVGDMDEVTVTIDNAGGSDLAIAGITLDEGITSHFALDDTGLDAVVPAGGSTSVTVAFAPGNGGRKAALLTIESDDTDEGTFTIELRARTTPNAYRALEPDTAPAPRFNVGLAATDDGRVLLFGGRGTDGVRLADTWVYDVEANTWTELSPPAAPSARDAHALAHVGGGVFVLFGGNLTNGPDESPQGDTWTFDLAAEAWTEQMPATAPPARFQHGMVEAGDGTAILYGGRVDFGVELSDTWAYDAATETWTDLAPLASPGPRSAFALAFDGAGTLVQVGGTVESSAITDETWRYDVAGNEWTMGAAAGLGAQFTNAAAWLEAGVIVTSGKTDIFGEPMPGTWVYDATADAWSDVTPKSEPAPRFAHRMVFVGGDKAILFGGLLVNVGPGSAVDETWEYVGP